MIKPTQRLAAGTLLRSKQGRSVKLYGVAKYVDLPYFARIVSFDVWANVYRAEAWVEAEKDGQVISQNKHMIVIGEFWEVNWFKA